MAREPRGGVDDDGARAEELRGNAEFAEATREEILAGAVGAGPSGPRDRDALHVLDQRPGDRAVPPRVLRRGCGRGQPVLQQLPAVAKGDASRAPRDGGGTRHAQHAHERQGEAAQRPGAELLDQVAGIPDGVHAALRSPGAVRVRPAEALAAVLPMQARLDGYVGTQVLREGPVLFRGCLQTAGGPEAHRLQAATQREDRAGGVRGRKSRVAQAGQLEGHAERRSGDAAFSQKGG